jgi:hypothetical protein
MESKVDKDEMAVQITLKFITSFWEKNFEKSLGLCGSYLFFSPNLSLLALALA